VLPSPYGNDPDVPAPSVPVPPPESVDDADDPPLVSVEGLADGADVWLDVSLPAVLLSLPVAGDGATADGDESVSVLVDPLVALVPLPA
jgi:hypothetical protein